ncbi:MAG: hypothetical protein MJY50_04760 [Bacteroidales bacterium]|nr:hypothetical protein [Bacteroidales bacterium]
MNRVLVIIASALLVLSAVSCGKPNDDLPPYYRIATPYIWKSGPSGTSDFSRIFAVTDQYINKDFANEEQAKAIYNDILSKTKDVPFSAPEGSYLKLIIEKYIAKQEDEHTARYDIDPAYKSPVGHIWDDKGSRDL